LYKRTSFLFAHYDGWISTGLSYSHKSKSNILSHIIDIKDHYGNIEQIEDQVGLFWFLKCIVSHI
jgi:hypothetical protein